MSDFADEMDARGQDHDMLTGDPIMLQEFVLTPKGKARLAELRRDRPELFGDDRDDLF